MLVTSVGIGSPVNLDTCAWIALIFSKIVFREIFPLPDPESITLVKLPVVSIVSLGPVLIKISKY